MASLESNTEPTTFFENNFLKFWDSIKTYIEGCSPAGKCGYLKNAGHELFYSGPSKKPNKFVFFFTKPGKIVAKIRTEGQYENGNFEVKDDLSNVEFTLVRDHVWYKKSDGKWLQTQGLEPLLQYEWHNTAIPAVKGAGRRTRRNRNRKSKSKSQKRR